MACAPVDADTLASNATAASQLLHLVERTEPITPSLPPHCRTRQGRTLPPAGVRRHNCVFADVADVSSPTSG